MKKFLGLFLTIILVSLCSCSSKTAERTIAVFVPGIVDDSPVYSMLVEGVRKAVDGYNTNLPPENVVKLFVMEAGTNQAEWSSKIISLVASKKYEVIISSNPSLPDLVEPITNQFPYQKFILLDATKEGNQNIATFSYNQKEQAYLSGYAAGLMSKKHKLALIAAQEYPVMNEIIFPYFAKGGAEAYEGTTTEFRVVGNWYDATKAAELTNAVISAGADVILPICGGAAQGVINTAVNKRVFVSWFDNNGFDKAPGTIISSTVMEQSKMAEKVTSSYLNGSIKWGNAEVVGMKDGFIDFIQDDPNYINTVPQEIQNSMHQLVSSIKSGELIIE